MRSGLAILALLLAGCADAPYDPSPGFGDEPTDARGVRLGGSFANDRTQEDIDAWCDVARKYGNECALMESYPEQFSLRFQTLDECEEARGELAAMPRVRPGACTRVA